MSKLPLIPSETPMPTSDEQRADWAAAGQNVIEVFREERCCENEDDETMLTDLLTDLMHWADARKIDFNDRLRVAVDNYKSEL